MVFGIKKEEILQMMEELEQKVETQVKKLELNLTQKLQDSMAKNQSECDMIVNSFQTFRTETINKFEKFDKKFDAKHDEAIQIINMNDKKAVEMNTKTNKVLEEFRAEQRINIEKLSDTFESYHKTQVAALNQEKENLNVVKNNLVELHTSTNDFRTWVLEEKERHDAKHQELNKQMDDLTAIADDMKKLTTEVVENINAEREHFSAQKEEQDEYFSKKLPQQIESLFEAVDRDCTQPMALMTRRLDVTDECIRSLDNLHTRGVTWILSGFKEKLLHMINNGSTCWSPEFQICSQAPITLNVRILSSEPDNERTIDRMIEEIRGNQPVAGSVCVEVWGYPGITMCFKLTVGKVTQIFDMRLDGPEGERVPFYCVNFCTLEQGWNRKKDKLKVNFEVVALKYNESTDHIIEKPFEAVDDVANFGTQERMIVNKYISSEAGVMEKLQKSLVTLKNRWVKQVDWEIKNMYDVLTTAEVGDSLESPTFSCAGLEKLRMVFYPRGLREAGFCSLFLSCPIHSRVKFSLSVGRQRRCLEYTFTNGVNDLCGKAKFCDLSQQLLEKGNRDKCRLTLSMEILEVELLQSSSKDGEYTLLKRSDPTGMTEMKKVMSLPALTSMQGLRNSKGLRPHQINPQMFASDSNPFLKQLPAPMGMKEIQKIRSVPDLGDEMSPMMGAKTSIAWPASKPLSTISNNKSMFNQTTVM